MAALDIVAAATANRNTNAISQSVTPVSGESLIAFLGIQGNLDTTVSAFVFNTSEALTHLGTTSNVALQHAIAIYYLAAPTATTANVAVTLSNSGPFRSNHLAVLRVVSLASTRTPEGATGTGGTMADTIASASGEKVVSASLLFRGTLALQAAAGDLTALVNTNDTSEFYMALGTAPGAVTVSADFGSGTSNEGNEPWVVHSVALQAAAVVVGRGLTSSLALSQRRLVGAPCFAPVVAMRRPLVQVKRPALVGFDRRLAA